MVLQAFVFGHPEGMGILLSALGTEAARFPAEVYARDENALPDEVSDATLSEFARGIRWAQKRVEGGPSDIAARYRAWLTHLPQLHRQLDRGTYYVDPLEVGELPLRQQFTERFGIGRGEAAGLVLACRSNAPTSS